MNFTNIKNFFLNIIFPHRCFVCGKIIDDCGFCEKCLKSKIQFIAQPTCSICGEGLEIGDAMLGSKLVCGSCSSVKHNFDRAISVFIYNDCIAKIMFLFKFKNKFFLSHFLFSYIKDKIKEFEDKIDFIMPVPIHIKKLRIRGYNQTVLLVKEFEKSGYKNVIYDLLIKTVYGRAQIDLKYKERKKNPRGSFEINEKYVEKIRSKNILIVDDIFTTGSTTDECARILKLRGAKKVFVLTVAKTSPKRRDLMNT